MNQLSIFYKSIFAIIVLASCESHEQKSDEAFNQFKDEKTATKDSVYVYRDTTATVEKNQPTKKHEKIDEDEKFKKSIENKVHTNELAIKKLKTTPNMNIKTLKKIIHLEEVNNSFINQLNDYDEEVKKNRKSFEEKINLEINELEVNLKVLNLN
jgi:hypothetical protein